MDKWLKILLLIFMVIVIILLFKYGGTPLSELPTWVWWLLK